MMALFIKIVITIILVLIYPHFYADMITTNMVARIDFILGNAFFDGRFFDQFFVFKYIYFPVMSATTEIWISETSDLFFQFEEKEVEYIDEEKTNLSNMKKIGIGVGIVLVIIALGWMTGGGG